MRDEPPIAFAVEDDRTRGLEVRVNFGVFAGREATPAELDELGTALVGQVGDVSVISEERHEFGEDVEASLHLVRLVVDGDHLPPDDVAVGELRGRVLATAEQWARQCIAERHAEVSEL